MVLLKEERMAEPTPRPWHINPMYPLEIWGPNEESADGDESPFVAEVHDDRVSGTTPLANAYLIVQAVNHHDALHEALEECLAALSTAQQFIEDGGPHPPEMAATIADAKLRAGAVLRSLWG